MALQISVDILGCVLTAWFWPHCARPALTALRAAPVAHRLVLGVTVLTVIAYALAAIADIAGIYGAARWWVTLIVGALWFFIVGFGYLQNYKLLLRATGRNDPPPSN